MADELTWLPAWRLRDLMVAGELSPVEVTGHFLERIHRYDGGLHAFLTVAADVAMAEARRLVARRGAPPGPLFGVPVSVKDQYRTAGLRTTSGSRAYLDHVPTVDATAVRRLRRAGAIVIGKTNMPEFGLFWRSVNLIAAETRNPWDPTRVAGGSSGGAAAGVAAGLTPVALGSDGGGSIRMPAAFCGIPGVLPTNGRVSRHGGLGGALQFTGVGPLARDVRDLATVLTVIAGVDEQDPTSLREPVPDYPGLLGRPLPPLRLGWWRPPEPATVDHDDRVVALARRAADTLTGQRVTVEDAGVLTDLERYLEAFQCISRSDRYGLHGHELYDDSARRGLLTPYVAESFAHAARLTGAQYARALRVRFEACRVLEEKFERFELLVSPTVGYVAPPVPRPEDLRHRPPTLLSYTFLANFTGLPAATVPCGFVDGLPVGLQVMGPPGAEACVLRVAHAFEVAGLVPGRPERYI